MYAEHRKSKVTLSKCSAKLRAPEAEKSSALLGQSVVKLSKVKRQHGEAAARRSSGLEQLCTGVARCTAAQQRKSSVMLDVAEVWPFAASQRKSVAKRR